MPTRLKVKIYRSVVRPVALYGCECWPAGANHERALHAMEMCTWLDHVTNIDVRTQLKWHQSRRRCVKPGSGGTATYEEGRRGGCPHRSPPWTGRSPAPWTTQEALAWPNQRRPAHRQPTTRRCPGSNGMEKSHQCAPCNRAGSTLGRRYFIRSIFICIKFFIRSQSEKHNF